MANIPGINTKIRPDVVVRQSVRTNTVALAGSTRKPLIIGEGLSEETLVSQARGGGLDGVNADYSGTNAPDGRHFQISKLDLVPARTALLKNGIPMNVLEAPITSAGFNSVYDARVDIATGRVELQKARLVDFGGTGASPLFYKKYQTNVGNGTLSMTAASLLDLNSLEQTWVVRCSSVVLDGSGIPVSGSATFTVSGSISGQLRDSNGNAIVWRSNGAAVSNGVLSFSIAEGSTAFRVNDKFSIQITSGVLNSGDRLEAKYIAYEDLNIPTEFASPSDLFALHGQPSTDNTLSLGAALAFENGASSVIAVQAMPPVPRKTSELLMQADNLLTTVAEGATGFTDMEDCIFPLDLGKVPDVDSRINFFVVSTDGSETQIALNKVAFYNTSLGTSVPAAYTNFCSSAVNSYTVLSLPQVEQSGDDGYLYNIGSDVFFTAPTVTFAGLNNDLSESGFDKTLVIYNELGTNTFGNYSIVSIGDGYGDMSIAKVSFVSGSGSVAQSGSDLRWQLVDAIDTSSYVCLSTGAVSTNLTAGKGLRVTYTDTKDADFFDTNWLLAYEAAETSNAAAYIVPLPKNTISNVFGAGKAHVIAQSTLQNANERILICGAINGLVPANLIGTASAAVEDIGVLEGIQGDEPEEVLNNLIEDLANYSVSDAFGDTSRVIYMAPDQIVRNIAGANTVLDGFYSAAAMAGFLSGKQSVAEPATNKSLTGFTIPRTRSYRPSVVNQLLDVGVCLLEPISTGGRIVQGITTAQSGAPEDEEISIVEIRDVVTDILRNSLRPFVGRINAPTMVQEVSASVDKILRSLVIQGLLTGYAGLSVTRDIGDATQINVGVRAFPTGPLNTIFADIEFTLGG